MAIPKYQYIDEDTKTKIISGQFSMVISFTLRGRIDTDVWSLVLSLSSRALNDLANLRRIYYRQQGKGTFVSRGRKHKLVGYFLRCRVFHPKVTMSLSYPLSVETMGHS